MAQQGEGFMLPSDEEALLAGDHEEDITQNRRAAVKVALTLCVLGLCGVALTVSTLQSPAAGASEMLPAAASGVIEAISADRGDLLAVDPGSTIDREGRRERLILEKDLEALFKPHSEKLVRHGMASSKIGPGACWEQAGQLFDKSAARLGFVKELDNSEVAAFKGRFSASMAGRCKGMDMDTWMEVAGKELEQQKPLMTRALADSINAAHLGFRVEMNEWLLNESVSTWPGRLGLLATSDYEGSVPHGRTQVLREGELPRRFRADEEWPECKEQILRIHNQGHCGSCWAFGTLGSIDSRMCIASGGKWNAPKDVLSRLHTTSCASPSGRDGCQGGLPQWAMDMLSTKGVVSESCLPYYISGEGTEHFEEQMSAPPCETHCQGGYSVPMKRDFFKLPNVKNSEWLKQVHGDTDMITKMKWTIYDEGPVTFAFMVTKPFIGYSSGIFSVCTKDDKANHAVVAYGWGVAKNSNRGGDLVEFFEASNSWGEKWGVHGRFNIHPLCVTDIFIAGALENDYSPGHKVGKVDADVPPDPDNKNWPWGDASGAECPYSNGCITHMEVNEPYVANEVCSSKKLNGKRIRVANFNTEFQYDVLEINGQHFSGMFGMGFDWMRLNGLKVDHNGIKFKADARIQGFGFKICAE